MSGLQLLCKLYGSIEASDSKGNKVTWVWDYANEKPILKSEMTKEMFAESEKVKWRHFKLKES